MDYICNASCPHCFKEGFPSSRDWKRHVKYCKKGSTPRKSLSERLQQGRNEDMSIRDVMNQKGVGGPPLLHGSDLPKKVRSVTIVVADIRPGPDDFNSIAIIDLAKEVYGCMAWAVNKTNMKALLEKAKLDDSAEMEDLARKLKGKKLILSTAKVNNPQTKKMVDSLFID